MVPPGGMKRATPAGLDIIVRALSDLSQILTTKKREYQGSVLETLTIDLNTNIEEEFGEDFFAQLVE